MERDAAIQAEQSGRVAVIQAEQPERDAVIQAEQPGRIREKGKKPGAEKKGKA